MDKEMNDGARPEQPTTAISIFDEAGASGDFPVLKAFQQYIDAEQAKARKRMAWLSAFFVTLLVVVVVAFSLIMTAVIRRDQENLSQIATRNQELSDKLLDIALRNRDSSSHAVPGTDGALAPVLRRLESLATAITARPTPAPAPAADNASAMKPVLEKLESLATAMAARPVVAPQPVPQPVQQPVADPEAIRLRDELRRLQAEMKAERQRLAKAEQEKKHQEEVERHRRRLYPEYYAREDAKKAEAAAGRAPEALPTNDALPKSSGAPLPAVEAVTPEQPAEKPPVVTPPVKKTPPAPPPALPDTVPASVIRHAKPVDVKSAKPISYFNDEEDDNLPAAKSAAPAPAATSGKKDPEVLKVGTEKGGTLPFLVELPDAK